MSARHPKPQRLQRWLDTGEPRRLSRHIERCAHCQETLDNLSALDEGLVADLQAATTPPEDLTERTHGGVDVRLRNEAAVGSFIDLFAIGFDFARTILDPDLDPETDLEITGGDRPHDRGDAADQSDGGL
ncbi:MAG: hypothetical protein AAF548_00540 [Actinomycetota bacterium]